MDLDKNKYICNGTKRDIEMERGRYRQTHRQTDDREREADNRLIKIEIL